MTPPLKAAVRDFWRAPPRKWTLPEGTAVKVVCRAEAVMYWTDAKGSDELPKPFLKVAYAEGEGFVDYAVITITSRTADTSEEIDSSEVMPC